MKGYRFYAEMPQDRKSKSASKACPFFPWTVATLRDKVRFGYRAGVVAVHLDDDGRSVYCGDGSIESMVMAIDGNHYSYCGSGVSREYLRSRCTRIPADLARLLSPQLFGRLES